jgi:hypothetical protein
MCRDFATQLPKIANAHEAALTAQHCERAITNLSMLLNWLLSHVSNKVESRFDTVCLAWSQLDRDASERQFDNFCRLKLYSSRFKLSANELAIDGDGSHSMAACSR